MASMQNTMDKIGAKLLAENQSRLIDEPVYHAEFINRQSNLDEAFKGSKNKFQRVFSGSLVFGRLISSGKRDAFWDFPIE